MVEHAKSRSLVTRVVTNGYWARTYEAAKEQLSVLRKSGLNEINFSTGDDHCKYVPLDYISNGCRSAIDMGLTTVVNVETAPDRKICVSDIVNRIELKPYINATEFNRRLHIIAGEWMMKKEPEQSIKNKENLQIYKHDTKGCSNIFKTITIDPYSDVYSCCGLTMRNMSSMKIGNIKKNSIMEIYSSQFEDFLKVWIHTDGPNNIMKYIYEKMGTEYDAEQEQIKRTRF